VGHPFEGADDLAGLSQLVTTKGTLLDVRKQRRDAESGLAVEQLIDFVW
jgi:hypothetical protein